MESRNTTQINGGSTKRIILFLVFTFINFAFNGQQLTALSPRANILNASFNEYYRPWELGIDSTLFSWYGPAQSIIEPPVSSRWSFYNEFGTVKQHKKSRSGSTIEQSFEYDIKGNLIKRDILDVLSSGRSEYYFVCFGYSGNPEIPDTMFYNCCGETKTCRQHVVFSDSLGRIERELRYSAEDTGAVEFHYSKNTIDVNYKFKNYSTFEIFKFDSKGRIVELVNHNDILTYHWSKSDCKVYVQQEGEEKKFLYQIIKVNNLGLPEYVEQYYKTGEIELKFTYKYYMSGKPRKSVKERRKNRTNGFWMRDVSMHGH